MTMMVDGKRVQVFAFQSLALAKSFANGAETTMHVILGEGKYWVCSGRDASRLVNAGYEFAA